MANPETEKQRLIREWGEMDTEFSSWLDQGRQISQYLLPRSGRFFTGDRNKGTRRYNNILDSTGTRALRILGAGLMSGATSPARPWFRLATPDPELMKFQSVKQWLDDTTRTMLDIFQRSNTYRALHTIYEELGAFGTAACLVLDDFDDVIRLFPLTYGEYRISAGPRGEVNKLARKFDMTVANIVAEFGYENCSTKVKNLYDSGALGQWITIYHFISPNTDRNPRLLDNRNMAWKSCYFDESDGEKFLREGGFKRFRVLAPRWSVTGGDIYGTGPGAESLGDIKQLQHEQLRKAEGIDYKTKPPIQVPSGMKNRDIDRLPGGVSFLDMTGPSGGVKTMFEVNLDLSHLLNDIQDVRNRINDTFGVPIFLMMANDQRSGVTATEIAEKHEEKLMMMGPTLERLHNECLDPLITITFERCLEAGILPPPPEELQGITLNVEFISVLAQAQRAITTNSTDRFVAGLLTVAKGKPSVLNKFNEYAWADDYADSLGVNPKILNDDKTVAAMEQAQAKQAQAAQASAMAEQASKTAKNLATSPTGGEPNALQDVTRAFQGYT